MTAVAVGLVTPGVGSASGSEAPPPSHAVFAAAPAAARNRENPYAGNADAVAAGRKLYLRNCASCHGENSRGTKRGPALISDFVKRASPGEMEWFLRNGSIRRGMPSWSGLPEQRRWQITAYLDSEQAD
jgi:mono/diheme cytochrome c family protein